MAQQTETHAKGRPNLLSSLWKHHIWPVFIPSIAMGIFTLHPGRHFLRNRSFNKVNHLHTGRIVHTRAHTRRPHQLLLRVG